MSNGEPAERPFGHPGIAPRWTSSLKEGVGTACSDASRIWFTLSHGILNEVYYPTVDRPQIRDMQFLITDGETFFHEEKRDLENEIEYLDRSALGLSNRDARSRAPIRDQQEIITDPLRACVLIRTRVEAGDAWRERLKVFVLLAPHLEGGGSGNSARHHCAARKDVLVAWKGRTCLALGVSTRFTKTSCGYVGFSDGWRDLKDNFRLDWSFEQAEDGNIAVIGEIDITEQPEFIVVLALGESLHAATTALSQSLSVPFTSKRRDFITQWQQAVTDSAQLSRYSGDDGQLYCVSHNLLLAHEDNTFKGAIIASAAGVTEAHGPCSRESEATMSLQPGAARNLFSLHSKNSEIAGRCCQSKYGTGTGRSLACGLGIRRAQGCSWRGHTPNISRCCSRLPMGSFSTASSPLPPDTLPVVDVTTLRSGTHCIRFVKSRAVIGYAYRRRLLSV
ncbi:MAG: hypothetical protein ACXWC3_05990 [Burkholderiales bacterium]